jgi:Zn-dependent M28 family amino/carboxypeptidase
MTVPRARLRSIQSLLALSCLFTARAPAQVPVRVACAGPPAALPEADSTQLMTDLSVLAADSMEGRETGTAGGARARRYLRRRFAAIGLDTLRSGALERFAPPHGAGGEAANVIGLVTGRSRPGRVILVTAHYDHLGVKNGQVYNGADDNASGTAALLAVATWFRRHRPAGTMMFVALDGEEEGLLGATAFVKARSVDPDSILININLDMVSRSRKRELFAVGPKRYPGLTSYLARTACTAPVALMLGHDEGWSSSEDWTSQSDQGVFHALGIPFVYFGVEDHADYHQPTDDVSRIDPAFFVGSTRAITLFTTLLDASPAAAEAARAGAGGGAR